MRLNVPYAWCTGSGPPSGSEIVHLARTVVEVEECTGSEAPVSAVARFPRRPVWRGKGGRVYRQAEAHVQQRLATWESSLTRHLGYSHDAGTFRTRRQAAVMSEAMNRLNGYRPGKVLKASGSELECPEAALARTDLEWCAARLLLVDGELFVRDPGVVVAPLQVDDGCELRIVPEFGGLHRGATMFGWQERHDVLRFCEVARMGPVRACTETLEAGDGANDAEFDPVAFGLLAVAHWGLDSVSRSKLRDTGAETIRAVVGLKAACLASLDGHVAGSGPGWPFDPQLFEFRFDEYLRRAVETFRDACPSERAYLRAVLDQILLRASARHPDPGTRAEDAAALATL